MANERHILYKGDYKYQLNQDYKINIAIKPDKDIAEDYIALDSQGNLVIKTGYAWDGVSGPIIDSDKNLRAALIHDALYQLMRIGKLDLKTHRKTSDKLFRNICKEDGVSKVWAFIYYIALCKYGEPAASPANKREELRAPEK